MNDRDVHHLRESGLDDDQITIAAQVIGYFNYITRIAQGLGVDPEPWMDVPRDAWLKRKTSWRPESGPSVPAT